MIAEKHAMVTIKVEEGEMERIFEVADLLKRIENEIYEDRTIKVTTLTIVEEPTGNTLSVNSKLDVDNFIDMIYYFHKFFDI